MSDTLPGPSTTARPEEEQEGLHWRPEVPLEDLERDSTMGDEPDWASSTASLASSVLAYRKLNGRTYHNPDQTDIEYWGPNDEPQNNILDLMHHVFTLCLGGKLYLAPLDPDKLTKALDIGTGTGVWCMDFADEYPNCEVTGTDISPIQPSWVPPNLKFEIEDFNADWTFAPGSVDYVHLRWLIGAVTDYDKFARQTFECIRPGGYMEVLEIDGVLSSDDGSVTEKSAMGQWLNLFSSSAAKLGLKTSFTAVRDELWEKAMRAAGFVNLQTKLIKNPVGSWPADKAQREIGLFARAVVLGDLEGTLNHAFDTLGWSKEERAVYYAHFRAEVKNPKIHGHTVNKVIYGQKPEGA